MAVYDAAGRKGKHLSSATQSESTLRWDGTDSGGKRLKAGVYFCRFTAGDMTLSKKVVLLE